MKNKKEKNKYTPEQEAEMKRIRKLFRESVIGKIELEGGVLNCDNLYPTKEELEESKKDV